MRKKRLHLVLGLFVPLVFMLGLSNRGFSQLAVNPFDLLPRLNAQGDSSLLAIMNNPFDIVTPNRRTSTTNNYSPGFIIEKGRDVPTAQQLANIYQRFKFAAVLVMLVWMALLFIIFRVLLGKLWEAFWNENMLNQLLRDRTPGIDMAYLIMYAFYFYVAGLFMFLSLKHYEIALHRQHVIGLAICVGGVMGAYLLKHIEWWLLRNILPAQRELTTLSFTTMVLSILAGLLLVPIVLFVAYAPAVVSHYAIMGGIVLLLLVALFLAFRGLLIGAPRLANSPVHFFLYLCAAEIAPVLLLYKAIFHGWVATT